MGTTSYDKLWKETWGDMQRFGPVHRHTLENLVRIVSSLDVKSVADIGCGSGENLSALAASGNYDLAGVDVSQQALKLASQRVPSARLFALDIQGAPLSERFDLVMSIQVIEHLPDDVSALRHMAEMADNYLLISTMQGRMRRSELAIGHVRNYSADELRQKIEAAGLHVQSMTGWGFPFYSPFYRSLVELLPSGPPAGSLSPMGRVIARALYHLYRLNWSGKGDVITAIATRTPSPVEL